MSTATTTTPNKKQYNSIHQLLKSFKRKRKEENHSHQKKKETRATVHRAWAWLTTLNSFRYWLSYTWKTWKPQLNFCCCNFSPSIPHKPPDASINLEKGLISVMESDFWKLCRMFCIQKLIKLQTNKFWMRKRKSEKLFERETCIFPSDFFRLIFFHWKHPTDEPNF